MDEVNFREAAFDDAPGILQLLTTRQEEASALYGDHRKFDIEQGNQLLDEMLQNDQITVIVGELDDTIIATLTMHVLPRIRLGGYFAIFEDVVVASDKRGKEIGSQLMKYAISLCKQNSRIKKIKLGSRIEASKAHSFYTKLGFIHKEKLFQLSLVK